MERLPGMLGGEPVYWIETVRALPGGVLETELGFSDVAAHPYEALVEATVVMLAALPGVEAADHVDREVVVVRSRGLSPSHLGDVVDRFWFDRLPTTPVDPRYRIELADLLPSPWPAAPPAPRGVAPAPEAAEGTFLSELREAAALPPSRRRLWTYLVFGLIPAGGGAVLALTPGGSTGALPLALGAVNLAVAGRIAWRRRQLAAPASA